MPIIDAHHHLWDRPGSRYMFEDFADDARAGHTIVGSVFVEASSRQHGAVGTMYRADGPEEERSLGETAFAAVAAAMARSGRYGSTGLCAGMVAYVDLRLGARADGILAQHAACPGVRGIRNMTAWHADAAIRNPDLATTPGMLAEPAFLDGFKRLQRFGLSFDALVFAPQIPELTDLARQFPDTRIVLDHFGGVMGTGSYAGRRDLAMAEWRRDLANLARCPNTYLKIGGMASPRGGFGLAGRTEPARSEELATLWRPYVETCVEVFGAGRCMFESNFPVDKQWITYVSLWNAFKIVTSGWTDAERQAVFKHTAMDFYRLDLMPACQA